MNIDGRFIYVTEVAVGGKLAQFGSRLIGSTARRLAERFYDNVARIVEEVPA